MASSKTSCRWAFDVSRWEPTQADWCKAMQSIQTGKTVTTRNILKLKFKGHISDQYGHPRLFYLFKEYYSKRPKSEHLHFNVFRFGSVVKQFRFQTLSEIRMI